MISQPFPFSCFSFHFYSAQCLFQTFPISFQVTRKPLPPVPVQITCPLLTNINRKIEPIRGISLTFLACPTNLHIWQSAFSSLLLFKWAPMVRCVFYSRPTSPSVFFICRYMYIFVYICIHTIINIYISAFFYM